MNKIEINKLDINDYIFDNLYSTKIKLEKINEKVYHHNTSYENAPLICEYGILSLDELNKKGIRNDTKEILKTLSNTSSHINGNDGISLSMTGLTDLYKDEDEYNPFNPIFVDFIISSNIKAIRNSLHYGNEFICYENINTENILSLDTRILEYINLNVNNSSSLEKVVDMYNSLIESALNIKRTNSNILIREMSHNNSFSIDIDKLSQLNKVIIKSR